TDDSTGRRARPEESTIFTRAGVRRLERASTERASKRERVALQEPAVALLADVLSIFDDDSAAREDVRRCAANFLSLVRGVVDAHVERLVAEDVLFLTVPHEEIGVAPDRDAALLRIEIEDLRGRRRRDLDEAVHRQLA